MPRDAVVAGESHIVRWEHVRDSTDGVFGTGRTRRIQFEEPETCPFLKDILRTTASGTPQEKLYALRDLLDAFPEPSLWEASKAVAAAVYVLENGVLPLIVVGLEQAERGKWLEVASDPEKPLAVQVFNKAATYAHLLRKLTHDLRSANYILHHAPNLIQTLVNIYLVEKIAWAVDASGAMEAIVHDTGKAIEGAFVHLLFWSRRTRKVLARSGTFLLRLLRRRLAHFDAYDRVSEALQIFLRLAPSVPDASMEKIAPVCLEVVTKVLSESQSRHQIEVVVLLLTRLAHCHFRTYRSHFLMDPRFIDCAKALAVCLKADALTRRLGAAAVWAELERKAGKETSKAEYEKMLTAPFGDATHKELCDALRSSHSAFERATVLHQIFERERSSMMAKLLAIIGKDNGEDSTEESREQAARGLEKRPPRKCSAAGCKNFETRSGEFKLCGKCKLTAYCTRGKLFLLSLPCHHLVSNLLVVEPIPTQSIPFCRAVAPSF